MPPKQNPMNPVKLSKKQRKRLRQSQTANIQPIVVKTPPVIVNRAPAKAPAVVSKPQMVYYPKPVPPPIRAVKDIALTGPMQYKSNQPIPSQPAKLQPNKPQPSTQAVQEEIDLTDDLAPTSFFVPTTNIVQYKGPPVPLPSVARSEANKLNFKFQKKTPKGTPDWTKYQNNFKRITASPDSDGEQPGEASAQNETVDLTSGQGKTENAFMSLPANVMEIVKEKLKELPAGKTPIIMPKMEESMDVQPKQRKESPKVPQNVSKESASTTKGAVAAVTSTNTANPIEVRFPRNRMNQNIHIQDVKTENLKAEEKKELKSESGKPDARIWSYEYPKGIPKSFLLSHQDIAFPGNVMNAFYDYPKGIPRSFLRQQEQTKAEPPKPSLEPTLPSTVPEYQLQTGLDLPSWILGSQPNPEHLNQHSVYNDLELQGGATSPTFGQHEPTPNRAYSPSDVYSEAVKRDEELHEGSESPEMLQSGQKRLSAFQRLGPLTKPKKPKLTINLMFNKEQSVREVVDESDSASFRFVPVHLRKDVLESNDEIVKKYLPYWPWKKNLVTRRSVSARNSKSVMILEQEQMEVGYERDNMFIQVSVKGYPTTWTKESVLDAILECVKGKSFIPCFIEFTPQECKFLVIRSRPALVALHKVGFCVRSADVELTVTISLTDTSLNQLDLIPRLILRRRILEHHTESSLDLSNFLAAPDVSHFMYFPLNRVTNQVELIQLQSAVAWEYLTELNLSNNRISNLDGLNLQSTTPKLRHLDLSHNLLDKVTLLLKCKDLPLRSIRLEGNPLCLDYVEGAHYIKVVKMIFSGLRELDGVSLTFKGDLPPSKMNYCPQSAAGVAEKFLETFFPLLEASFDDRAAIEAMYDEDAVLTVTFRYKLRYGSAFRYFRNLFVRARNLEEGDMESVRGAPAIAELVSKWPPVQHDRYTITVDTVYHDDSTTILRLGGILKLTAETLAEDEHLLTFGRTVVLHTKNGAEYKILNEMLYWDVPREEVTHTAFNITTVRNKPLSVKLESPPDEDLKSKLLTIFLRIADLDKKRGERCLEKNNWDLRSALEFYMKLLKLDDLSALDPEKETPLPEAS